MPRLLRAAARCLALLAFAATNPVWSATYYIAADGNDAAAGTSPATAWKSVSKAGAIALKPGDNVLFKRGSVFEGMLYVQKSGTAQAPITYADYGTGEPPVIDAKKTYSYALLSKNNHYLAFKNIVFRNAPYEGMYVAGHDLTFEGIESRGHTSHGLMIAIQSGSPLYNLTITDSIFAANGKNGLSIQNAVQVKNAQGVIQGLAPCRGCTFRNITLQRVTAADNTCFGARIGTGTWSNGFPYDTWTPQDASSAANTLWSIPQPNPPENGVLFSGVAGTAMPSVTALDGPRQWHWEAGRLYVWAETNPSGFGTGDDNFGIEVVSRFENVVVEDSRFLNNGTTGQCTGRGLSLESSTRWMPNITFSTSEYHPTYWSEGARVTRVEAAGNGEGGITIAGYSAERLPVTLSYSRTHSNGTHGTLGGIWTAGNKGLIIEHNESYNNTSPGIDGVGIFIDQHDEGVIVRHNKVYGNLGAQSQPDEPDLGGGGIALYNSRNSLIHDNILTGNRTGLWIRHPLTVGHRFYNNIVADNLLNQIYWSTQYAEYPSAPANAVEVTENILSGRQTTPISPLAGSGTPRIEANCIEAPSLDIARYALQPEAGNQYPCKPGFADPSHGDYNLTPINFLPLPARSAGVSFTVSADTVSGLVTFASATPAVCTVQGNLVTLLQSGECQLGATQPGSSTPTTQSFTVTAASPDSTAADVPLPAWALLTLGAGLVGAVKRMR